MSPVGGNLGKLNAGAQLNRPPPSKSAFMAKSGAQCLTFKSVTDKQSDRQTDKKLNVFGRPGGPAAGEIRAPPW